MKSKEELNVLKTEFDNLCKKINELSKDELKEVTGGGLKYDGEELRCEWKESYRPHTCPNQESVVRWFMNMYPDAPCHTCKKNRFINSV